MTRFICLLIALWLTACDDPAWKIWPEGDCTPEDIEVMREAVLDETLPPFTPDLEFQMTCGGEWCPGAWLAVMGERGWLCLEEQ